MRYVNFIIVLLFTTNCFYACKEKGLQGAHSFKGGEVNLKIGSFANEKISNGAIQVNLDSTTFWLAAGSANTKSSLIIAFDLLTNGVPATYSFSAVEPYASADYFKETSNDLLIYSAEWGVGLTGSLTITAFTEDYIEGNFEFVGKDPADGKVRTVKGSFSMPKE